MEQVQVLNEKKSLWNLGLGKRSSEQVQNLRNRTNAAALRSERSKDLKDLGKKGGIVGKTIGRALHGAAEKFHASRNHALASAVKKEDTKNMYAAKLEQLKKPKVEKKTDLEKV